MSSLLEVVVCVAILAVAALAVAAGVASHARRTHATALALEAAFAEARALAAAAGDTVDAAYPSGATVVVEGDPAHAGDSLVAVYRSRPIARGGPAFAPPADAGFPAQHVAGRIRFSPATGSSIEEPFAVMISGAGFASVGALGGPYQPSQPQMFARDPGCVDGALVVDVEGVSESHEFSCSGASYVAN